MHQMATNMAQAARVRLGDAFCDRLIASHQGEKIEPPVQREVAYLFHPPTNLRHAYLPPHSLSDVRSLHRLHDSGILRDVPSATRESTVALITTAQSSSIDRWGSTVSNVTWHGRNLVINEKILDGFIPNLPHSPRPPIVHLVADGVGVGAAHFYNMAAERGVRATVLSSTLARDIFHITAPDGREAFFGSRGELIQYRRNGTTYTKETQQDRREQTEARGLFTPFIASVKWLEPHERLKRGGLQIQRVPLIDPRALDLMRRDPAHFKSAEVDITSEDSVRASMSGKRSDVVVAANIHYHLPFQRRREMVRALGRSLREGGFLMIATTSPRTTTPTLLANQHFAYRRVGNRLELVKDIPGITNGIVDDCLPQTGVDLY